MNELDDFYVGKRGLLERTITMEDVLNYAELSGDFNPVHINEEKAKLSIFNGRIVHGLFVASMFSNVIGMVMPGEGTIYISQNLNFKKPVYIGETVKAVVTIEEMKEKNRALLSTIIYNQKKEIVIDGNALVLLPRDKGVRK